MKAMCNFPFYSVIRAIEIAVQKGPVKFQTDCKSLCDSLFIGDTQRKRNAIG